jgi:hypothetical protein
MCAPVEKCGLLRRCESRQNGGMLSLDPIPHDTDSLRAALAGALVPLGLSGEAVRVEGDFPSVAALGLNLTGARFHRALRFSHGAGEAQPAFFVRDLEVTAAPAYAEALPFTLSARGSDAVFSLAGPVLSLTRCGAGTLEIAVEHADLESALTAIAREAAEKKGAELRSVQVTFTAEGPRSLRLRAVAEAKAMFFTATLTITGRVEVDDAMEVRLTGLGCSGDGMIANLAAGSIRTRLTGMEGRRLALRDFVPNLRSLVLEAEGGLRIRAEIGG